MTAVLIRHIVRSHGIRLLGHAVGVCAPASILCELNARFAPIHASPPIIPPTAPAPAAAPADETIGTAASGSGGGSGGGGSSPSSSGSDESQPIAVVESPMRVRSAALLVSLSLSRHGMSILANCPWSTSDYGEVTADHHHARTTRYAASYAANSKNEGHSVAAIFTED